MVILRHPGFFQAPVRLQTDTAFVLLWEAIVRGTFAQELGHRNPGMHFMKARTNQRALLLPFFFLVPSWMALKCILAEGAIALLVTLSGSALFAS